MDRATRLQSHQLLEDSTGHRIHVDHLRLDPLASESGEGEEIVDKASHPLGLATDDSDHASSLVIELGGVVFLEDP